MSLSNSLLSYQDCIEAMETALADPQGGRVHFPDQASALHFRSRCHYARKLHRAKNAEIYPDPQHPQHGCSHYDELILRERADGEGCYIYLERAAPGSIKVEPLSEVKQIAHQPQRQLPPPEAMPTLVETIIKRRI